MKQVSITKAVKIKNQHVKPFNGERDYMATGGLVGSEIKTEKITYKTKPSRADLLVCKNQLIVARMKGTNKVLLVDENSCDLIVSTGFLVLDVQDGWLPGFLYHFFVSNYFQDQKDKFSIGATQKAINNAKFKEILIPELSLEDQKRIVKIFDEADVLRQKRKKAIDLLDEYLKSVFLDMFGKTATGFQKWEVVEIQNLAEDRKGSMRTGPFGSDLRHSEFVKDGVAVVGIDNAVQNKFAWKEKRFITSEKYEKLKRYRLYPRDVIVTIMATIGRSAVIPDDIPLAINTKHLASITLNKKLANPYFISYSLHSNPIIKKQIEQQNIGAIMPGLNLGIIKKLKIRKPPIDLQNLFEDTYHKIQKIKEKMADQSIELDNQFQALIQKSFLQ